MANERAPTVYVQVPVPAELVVDVMAFVVERSGHDDRTHADFGALIARSYEESTQEMRRVLDVLVDRSPSWVLLAEVRDVLGLSSVHMLPGVLSSFSRRWRGRYGQDDATLPFDKRGSGEQRRYRMRPDAAAAFAEARDMLASMQAVADEARKEAGDVGVA